MSSMIRRLTATGMAAVFAIGVSPLLVAQQLGTISGKADDETSKPPDQYSVQLEDIPPGAQKGQIVATVDLDPQERFAFTGVAPDKRYMVHLFDKKDQRIVCSEGPYSIVGPNMLTKTDVDIDCDKPPAILWWGAAILGVAATVALLNGCEEG